MEPLSSRLLVVSEEVGKIINERHDFTSHLLPKQKTAVLLRIRALVPRYHVKILLSEVIITRADNDPHKI